MSSSNTPKWPFDKFVYADNTLGTQMMATGEVMAIGNNFEGAHDEGRSSTELGLDTMTLPDFREADDEEVMSTCMYRTPSAPSAYTRPSSAAWRTTKFTTSPRSTGGS